MVIQYTNNVLCPMGDYFSRVGAGLAGPKPQATRGGAETSRLERVRER